MRIEDTYGPRLRRSSSTPARSKTARRADATNIWDALLQARPPDIAFHALIDPDGPALNDPAAFDAIHPNAYAAAAGRIASSASRVTTRSLPPA